MKILIATGIYPPDIGGMATFVKMFSTRLSNAGHNITVVAYGNEDKNFEHENVNVTIVARNGGKLGRYLKFAQKLKEKGKDSDIVYAQDLISSGLPAAWNSLFSKKSLILRLGGDFLWEQAVERSWTNLPLAEYLSGKKSLHEKFYIWIYKFVLSRSKFVIFNSEMLRNLYAKVFKLDPVKTMIIGNVQPERMEMQDGTAGDFVFAGRFIKLKNLRRLLKAFLDLNTSKALKLIGDGPSLSECEKLIIEFGLKNRVQIVNTLPKEELMQEFRKAVAVVIPSLTEVNPNVALEAIACGTPVLITKNNGLPLRIGSKLRNFDPLSVNEIKEQMQKLLNPEEYNRYKDVIKSLELQNKWENVIDEHLNLFSKHANS